MACDTRKILGDDEARRLWDSTFKCGRLYWTPVDMLALRAVLDEFAKRAGVTDTMLKGCSGIDGDEFTSPCRCPRSRKYHNHHVATLYIDNPVKPQRTAEEKVRAAPNYIVYSGNPEDHIKRIYAILRGED